MRAGGIVYINAHKHPTTAVCVCSSSTTWTLCQHIRARIIPDFGSLHVRLKGFGCLHQTGGVNMGVLAVTIATTTKPADLEIFNIINFPVHRHLSEKFYAA